MATTHIFIVDSNTFKYHLEYGFAGTGAKDVYVDFNNSFDTILHHQQENNLVEMIADGSRIRPGDYIVFYLQQNLNDGIKEGKFFGIFQATSTLFLDNNDEKQYLKKELKKSLTFRVLIRPFEVYSEGITEWEALDEIKYIQSPNQILWSLIYRKLKGNRGNTMITLYESARLFQLIRDKNSNKQLTSPNFSFDKHSQTIVPFEKNFIYKGRQEPINILPRLLAKFNSKQQFETHLQAFIIQNIEQRFPNEQIEWIGNEVYCGVGMQRIDILFSSKINEVNRKIVPIELKSTIAKPEITVQLQRYIDWLNQYYLSNIPSQIEPMIIAKHISNRSSQHWQNMVTSFRNFNQKNNLKIKYVEFLIINNVIQFTIIDY